MRIAREVVQHPDASMRCLRLSLAAFGGALHRHPHVELTWIERGSGLRWVGGAVEPFADGDLVLVGSDLPHLWVTPPASTSTTGPAETDELPCRATVVQFPPDWAASTGWPELGAVAPLLARARQGLAIGGPTQTAVQALLPALAQADGLRRVARLAEILATLVDGSADLRPLSAAGAAAEPGGRAGPSGRRQRLDRLLNWIQSHLAEELRVADAAQIVHVSPSAFSRYFRREVGRSFAEYVNDARCSWACLRLLDSDASIAEIATACGFPTLSHFGEQFRRRHGLSPRAWRQRRQGVRPVQEGKLRHQD